MIDHSMESFMEHVKSYLETLCAGQYTRRAHKKSCSFTNRVENSLLTYAEVSKSYKNNMDSIKQI